MQAPKTTIWEMPELTPAKHQLLRNYLEWWFPTMLQKHETIRFIDGFAGPGEYENHEPGSPIIAIDVLRRSVSNREQMSQVAFWFIDEHEGRCNHLYGQINKLQRTYPAIADLRPTISQGCFARVLSRYFSVEEKRQTTSPTFTFIDPFGVSDTPLSIISRLMKYPHNEVLITFMHEGVNRCLTQKEKQTQKYLRELFGAEPCHSIDLEGDRVRQICSLYCKQLQIAGNITYIGMIQLQSMHQGTGYFLVFGTHNRESLEKMKDIFWEMDPKEGSTYLASIQNQPYLIPPEPDYVSLARELRYGFTGKTISVYEVEEYVLGATRFRKKDIEYALRLLVQASQVSPLPAINIEVASHMKEYRLNFL